MKTMRWPVLVALCLTVPGPAFAQAAAAKYRELRDEHYGSHSYDFSERTVLGLAEELFRGGQPKEAEAMIDLNLEFFPESTMSYGLMAELQRRQGETEKAKAALKKGLEIDPENRRLKWIQEQLAGSEDPG